MKYKAITDTTPKRMHFVVAKYSVLSIRFAVQKWPRLKNGRAANVCPIMKLSIGNIAPKIPARRQTAIITALLSLNANCSSL